MASKVILTCLGSSGPPKPTPTRSPTPTGPAGIAAPHGRVQLVLQELDSYGTTDSVWPIHNDDEVYYRMGGTNGAGQSIGGSNSQNQATDRRGPGAAQGADADQGTAWDMSDSGGKQHRHLNAILDEQGLQPGQVETLYLVVEESDGTNYGPYAKYGATAVGALIGGPTAAAIAAAVGSAVGDHLINNDDVLGNFGLQIQNNGGYVSIKSLSPGSYASITYLHSNLFTVHFDHDGGVYDATFFVQGM